MFFFVFFIKVQDIYTFLNEKNPQQKVKVLSVTLMVKLRFSSFG